MKKLKIFAVIFAVCLTFTACSSKDDDKNNSGTSSNGGVVSDVVSDGKEVVSGVESGVESMLPGDHNSTMNSMDNSEDASKDASLDAPANTDMNTAKLDLSSITSLNNEKHGWGQGKDVDDKNRPISCDQFQNKYGNLDASFIRADDEPILLTFDEGYENGYTAKILDVLKEKKCPAVFFVTMPYVKENPDLIKRMIDEGHTVGNHTVNHPSMPDVELNKAASEITGLHDYVQEQFHYTMTLFRPPMGEWSERTLALTQQLGYTSVFWSFAYKDWITDDQPDPAASLEKITKAAHPGAIYLLHAVSSTNTAILGDFIDRVRAEGYEFKTV